MYLWNTHWVPKLCPGKGKFENMQEDVDLETARQGIQLNCSTWPLQKQNHTQIQLDLMPPRLCEELVEAIDVQMQSGNGAGNSREDSGE